MTISGFIFTSSPAMTAATSLGRVSKLPLYTALASPERAKHKPLTSNFAFYM